MRRFKMSIGLGLGIGLVAVSALHLHSQGKTIDWRYFGADKALHPLLAGRPDHARQRQEPADGLAASGDEPGLQGSVSAAARQRLPAGDADHGGRVALHTQDAHGPVSAFDAASGDVVWQQEPFARTESELQGQSTRGVDYWRSGGDQRIFAVRGEYLYALNAKTGKPYPDFGDHGRASLHFEDHQPLAAAFNDTTGPLVVGNVVVVTGNTAGAGDGGVTKEAAPENVRGYDAKSGKLLRTFHVVPQAGESGVDSWGNESWRAAGDIGAWNPMSADDQLGYVYIPLTAPTASQYGGWRPGANLYSDSLVALDARTGARVWHFQIVHHDPPSGGAAGRRDRAVESAPIRMSPHTTPKSMQVRAEMSRNRTPSDACSISPGLACWALVNAP